jgi:CheY-like chemotaxis protein
MTVRLPRVGLVPVAPLPPPAVSRRRILLIDDNRDFVEGLVSLLESLGHEALGAFDASSGVAAALQFRPELVFLDIGLPDVSGYEMVGRLRRVAACRTIPIIAVSGYARATDKAQALAAGFTAHIAKPIDVARIEKAIGEANA